MGKAWAGPLPPCVPWFFLIQAASQGCRKWGQEHFGVRAGSLNRGQPLPRGEQKPSRSLLRPEAACAVAPAQSCPGSSLLRLQSIIQKASSTRGRLERGYESLLKGNAVVVLRHSFHICGWRFPGFSEVNAGSARCRQIRFTSDLSNRLAAHWLLLLPPANVASKRPTLTLGCGSHMCTDPAAPYHKSLPFEAATDR